MTIPVFIGRAQCHSLPWFRSCSCGAGLFAHNILFAMLFSSILLVVKVNGFRQAEICMAFRHEDNNAASVAYLLYNVHHYKIIFYYRLVLNSMKWLVSDLRWLQSTYLTVLLLLWTHQFTILECSKVKLPKSHFSQSVWSTWSTSYLWVFFVHINLFTVQYCFLPFYIIYQRSLCYSESAEKYDVSCRGS